MKKLIASILAVSIVGAYGVYANNVEKDSSDDNVMLITEEIQETVSEKRVVEGIVKSVSETQIELEDLVLNIGEETLIATSDLVPAEVKEGDLITAVASTAATFSIPAQSAAYYVIIRESEEAMAPIYMTVDKVEDGFIYSEDGNYEVSFETAEVGMYRTKNIVKAEELTKGSEIFVYADVMTMSIPALVNPSKIVIMSIAEVSEEIEGSEIAETKDVELDKAKALNEEGILLGTENGLELDREVLRSEAVALIHRTSPADRMAYHSSFDDVPESHWAYIAISWAVEKKIVEGVGDNKFEPDRGVTAKELSKMFFNALGEEVEFEDAFEKACETGFVAEEDGIKEDDVLTREATAKMIYNYLNR